MSWARATSPISSTTGPSWAAATPNAAETVPSIPFAPRLESTRGPDSRAGRYSSTSRIGIEEATNRVPSGLEPLPERARHERLGQLRAERFRERPAGGIVRRSPRSSQPGRAGMTSPGVRPSSAAWSGAGRRAPTTASGSCQAPSASIAIWAASRPASHVRRGLDVGRSPVRITKSGRCAAAKSGSRRSRS